MILKKEKILVTGCAGFIGMHLCQRLLDEGHDIIGLDNLNSYYSVELKKDRLKNLLNYKNFKFYKIDIIDGGDVDKVFQDFKPSKVVNLAAQAGVRYSLENPHIYISSNIIGFMNILESSKKHNVKGVFYASSSSVYGSNEKSPFNVKDSVDNPISIYAVTKRSNELMAFSFNHLYNIKTTGLRFFTVYRPWGRPDMAMFKFVDKILNQKKINVYNHGNHSRSFTYIDDIIDGVVSAIYNNFKCEIFNLGNDKSEELMGMIKTIENYCKKTAIISFKGPQLGDVKSTIADINYSKKKLNFSPKTPLNLGTEKFIDWYKDYYKIVLK